MKIVKKKLEPQQKKLMLILAAVAVALIAVVVIGYVFTGDISYTYTDTGLQVTNSYINGVELTYEDMDSVELRQSFEFGVRGYGFGSARLAMGVYQNEEFEAYTLYAYKSCDSVVLIRSGEKVLVLNCKTAEQTQTLYKTLLEKVK